MTIPDALIPLINLAGTGCTLYPAYRAAKFLRSRSTESATGGGQPKTKFDEHADGVDRQLESLAQHWSPQLFWTFVVGVLLLVVGALLQLFVALDKIAVA